MKAINLMRLIPHINPVRTSMMRMNFSQVTRHISAMPQQVSCIRGRNVGIRTTCSLDRKIHSRLWDVGISCSHSESELRAEASKPDPRLLPPSCRERQQGGLAEDEPFPPSGTISALVLRKLSHNKPLSTAKLFRTDPKPGGFLLEGGAAAGSWGLLRHLPSPSWHWH